MSHDRSAPIGDATLTASGIARLAGVGRAAVSNWRRRYADFPAPVGGTPASPYFDAHEVDQWLRRQGKLHKASTEQWAWRHIETHQPAAHIGDVLGMAGAYLLVQSEQPARGTALLTPKQLVARLRALDHDLAERVAAILPDEWGAQLTTTLSAVDQLAREHDPEDAFEYLHNQYVSSPQSMSGLAGTPDSVVEAMLALTGVGARVLDFTCGTGSILRTAAHRALDAGLPAHCLAQEIKAQYALIALIRLWFVHRRAQRAGYADAPAPTLYVGDSLLDDGFPNVRAEIVVANFPFGIHDWGHDRLVYDPRWAYGLPPRTEPELAWVQHALAHLAPGGVAVVLMPPAAAARPAGRRIRAELVRRGALRAVIALPAGLMPPAGIGLHIWVLTQPKSEVPPESGILFVDASRNNPPADVIGKIWHSFQADDYEQSPGLHRVVAPIELLDNRVDLTPQRHLPQPTDQAGDPGQTVARVSDLKRRLTALADVVPVIEPTASGTLRSAPLASLADLVRSGSISVQRAARDADDATRPQAGDIIMVVVGQEIIARVVLDDDAGSPLQPGSYVISIDADQFDPWFVAGSLSRSDTMRTTSRATGTSGGARIDLRRFSIPVLSLVDQQRYGQAFRALAEFQAGLESVTELGGALAREIGAGLTAGTLVPPH